MAGVQIGHARIDENGKATGGKAGDQTGKEVMISPWYKHTKIWDVLRPKDPAKSKLLAQAMRAAANNNNIGYDQSQRDTLYNEAKKYGFDPSKVKVPVETDCSALVRVCAAFAGIMLPNFNTVNQASVMMATGQFEKLTASKYINLSDYLCEGDVLVTRTKGHTAIVLNNGPKAGTVTPPATITSGNVLEVTGATVNVRSGPSTSHKIHGVAKRSEKFVCTGNQKNVWYEIVYKNGVAWISGKYAEVSEVETPPVTVAPGSIVLVTGGTVNVRRGPSTSDKILFVAKKGSRFVHTGNQKNSWFEIEYSGGKAWISSKYADVE